MRWLFLLIVSGLFYGLYNFFIKLSSGHIHQVLGAVILQATATLVGLAILLYLKLTGHEFVISPKGIGIVVAAGMVVALGEILAFVVFSKGIEVSVGTPIIIGTAILFASILGFIVLREGVSVYNILGILLIVSGVALIGLHSTQNA